MSPVFVVFLILHILLSVILVVVVLVQQRTKGGLAGVFGGGGGGGTGAEQIFGSSGVAPFMTKITSVLGAVFLATSLALVLLSGSPRAATPAAPAGEEPQQGAPIPSQEQPQQGTQQPAQIEEQIPRVLPDTTGGQ